MLSIYGLAMSSRKLEDEASAIVTTSDNTGGSVDNSYKNKSSLLCSRLCMSSYFS